MPGILLQPRVRLVREIAYVHVLQRNWHLFDILRARSEARLPAILSGQEVRARLRSVRTPHNHAFLSTVYACGLRRRKRSTWRSPTSTASAR
jgi:hypothetical protein